METGMPFKATRLTKVYEMSVPASCDQVFPLLCPTREYDWLPYWECNLIHSVSGLAEEGCVFETNFPGRGCMTWVVTKYDPPKHIQYTIFKPGSHIWNLGIALTPLDAHCSRLTWDHTFTGLAETGNRYLTEYTDEGQSLALGTDRKMPYPLSTNRKHA